MAAAIAVLAQVGAHPAIGAPDVAPDGILTDRLVLMTGDVGIPGDSGGNCAGGEVFSVADRYDEALGLTVPTS